MPKQDDLNRRLVETLNHSLDQFDAQTLESLAARRQAVLARKRRYKQSAWAAVAAAIFVAIALPLVYQPQPEEVPLPQTAYYSVDPEMLEVMDMLMALGELAEEEPDAI